MIRVKLPLQLPCKISGYSEGDYWPSKANKSTKLNLMGRLDQGPLLVRTQHLATRPSITLQAMKECMQGTNKEGHNLLDHGCQMILRCQVANRYTLWTRLYTLAVIITVQYLSLSVSILSIGVE